MRANFCTEVQVSKSKCIFYFLQDIYFCVIGNLLLLSVVAGATTIL